MSIISCPTGRQFASQIGMRYSMEWLNQSSFIVSPTTAADRGPLNADFLCAKVAVLRDTTKGAFSITDVLTLVPVSLITRVCLLFKDAV
jgi:hypothetical protein